MRRVRPALCGLGLMASVLALSSAPSRAQNSACGMSMPAAGAASSLAADNLSDLSLAYQAEQPAGPISCGYGYFAVKCGDFATAHKIFDKCIAKGYAGAMIWKGLMYEDGTGVPKDPAKATALFKMAADSGSGHYAALGKLHYASALHEGHGVARDEAQARKWFERAAAEGSEDAQEFLRTGHHTGSRNQQGVGVGVAHESVKGQALRPQAPATAPPWLSWRHLLLALALLGLLALGAWRQGRGQSARTHALLLNPDRRHSVLSA